MTEIDDLFRRVEAAKATLDESEHNQARRFEELARHLDEATARLERQDALIHDREARHEVLKTENRQLKTMLLSLLAAVESRSGRRIQDTLRDMDDRVSHLAAAEPEPEPEPPPVLVEPEPEPDDSDQDLPPAIRRMLFADEEENTRSARPH
ncbi:MAG: hypothetical protein H7841_05005 [Magnetospirillum sp. WYHS-4]